MKREKVKNDKISLEEIMKYNSDTSNDDYEDSSNGIDFIHNPLPLPKKKEHTGMDYALKIDDNDDFDLKDMTGMDFFDYD